MDLPVFHLDFLNNRMLIALIAVLHVIINHSMAVGGIPLVAFLEHRGHKLQDPEWDRVAHRIMTVFFVTTTTVGALTGVGIWFSVALVNPYAIGSLIRVFFWAWFAEWLVFVTEVVLILWYYLTWKQQGDPRKGAHVRLGFTLAGASWATMAIIVAILGFMMDPGSWRTERSLFSGVLNPIYLPQLAFRTPLAMIMAGAFAMAILVWATPRRSELRARFVRAIALWILCWTPLCVLGGLWYAHRVPTAMAGNLPVALLTQLLAGWAQVALKVLGVACGLIGLIALWGALAPRRMLTVALVLPALLSMMLMATFERVREFIRKPYAIADYMYANGIRKDDYPLLQRDGLLTYATYTPIRTVTAENQLAAGREVFLLACTRCHTVDGVTGVRTVLGRMYGPDKPWDAGIIASYIKVMHNARPYMPPFPGNDAEREALAAYLVRLQTHREGLEGAQTTGVNVLPPVDPVTGKLTSVALATQ